MRTLSLQGAAQHHTGLKRWSQVLNSHWLPPDPVVMILTITKKGQMGRWMDETNGEQKHNVISSDSRPKISL